jgi:NADH:ubiquinone oxidoreductase subunit F (NADH-binding)
MVIADSFLREVDLGVVGTPLGSCARLGEPHGVLLAGPPAADGPESLEGYVGRVGHSPPLSGEQILAELRASGLQGRGGGSFPLWRKLEAALESGDEPLLVINCSESEPASRKDWTLCSFRPHTVLDGAAAIGRAVGAGEVVIHLHGWASEPRAALRHALRERGSPPDDPRWRLSYGPGGYVSGEASAIARYLHSGVALPLFSSAPLARRGPSGRPTVVSNAETAAHVAAIVRSGASQWRAVGTAGAPGPHLVTLSGAVARPGTVLEVGAQTSIGELLRHGGVVEPPQAVLVGGYAGTWIDGEAAWHIPWSAEGLRRAGAARGCGLIGVLPHDRCGIAETARLVTYLAGESAGQCGPCVHGLPVLAEGMTAVARGSGARRALRHVRRTAEALPGSGACAHPDGVVRLVHSTLEVFGDDLIRHRRRKPCRVSHHTRLFPLHALEGLG